eukprot:GHVU01104025.1.p1 GENE.GHVU01104025.1~~GHVU01104025.1.p1  ORF type:complete len:187 (+),score=25.71 GHVU01104025.1:512-1072(+)
MIWDHVEEFNSTKETLSEKLSRFSGLSCQDEICGEAAHVEALMRQLKGSLDGIEFSVREWDPHSRRSVQAEVSGCRDAYEQCVRRWLGITRQCRDLLPYESQRRAVAAVEKLDRSSQRLEDALIMAKEAEVIASRSMTNLYSQRETIQRTKANLGRANTTLKEADMGVARMKGGPGARIAAWWRNL